ncbi:flagellar filament capping protein FliD [Kurthia sp. Dielmo]|uniref:flagellar filament capping protein FliD n=1 Tax=Kurthia sp. Dielmo TaxID=1033738 RepID=UPI0002E2C69A|nr:flagellar filament capping protein FliD [Kurthia sp. Dielmo]
MATVNGTASSQATYSYLQYKNKIGGLVSGMDIDSIMEKLMKAESAQMEKLQQQKQKYEWKRDAYREVNTSLSAFRDGLWDNYGQSSSWNVKAASSSSSSISVTATNSASGNLEISEATMATAGLAKSNSTTINSKQTLAELGLIDGTVKLQGLDSTGTKLVEKEIAFKSTDTVQSFLNSINSSGVGITAIIANNANGGSTISLKSNTTGEGVQEDTKSSKTIMGVTTDAQDIFSKLGFSLNEGNFNTGNTAKNASMTVNGVTLTQATNSFEVAGYKMNLTQDIAANSKINITSTTNTDDIVKKVKEFVETYNGLIKDLNTKTSEKKNITYEPLTDAQKSEMTETEIVKWEEKAKAGLLKGDSNLNKTLSAMRQTLSEYGASSGNSLYNLGITTSKTWSENGKLEIDEDKLRSAIEKDPNAVTKVFNGDSTAGETGIIAGLRKSAKESIDSIERTAGKATSTSDETYSLGKTIIGLNTKIEDWKDRLKSIEERYWNQFSAMETAIQKANNQSSIFSQ